MRDLDLERVAGPTRAFWQDRFDRGDLPWDRGQVSPQVAAWLAAGVLQAGQRVAVPGCGSGHEVLALAQAGCKVVGVDYAQGAVDLSRARLLGAGSSAAQAAAERLVCADVLQWQPAEPLDAVYDQTCWCALHPDRWSDWAAQLHRWIRPGGSLCLLAMQALRDNAAEGVIEGPPYHLDIHMLRALLPATRWRWPAPPYTRVDHKGGRFELALHLQRR